MGTTTPSGLFNDIDVVVIGGGPAGSTFASLVAKRGHRVALLEKETFPRYQIGESLLPSTVHGICRITGVADDVARAGFVRKRGGTLKWGASPEPWTLAFADSPIMGEAAGYSYQVERMKFDQILLDGAVRNGAQVHHRCTVTGVVEDDTRVTGVRFLDENRVEHTVRARYVVDASGNTSRTHRHVGGTRTYSDFFRNLALFGYFEGGKRLPEPNSGNVFTVAFTNGWFWYIPLSDTLTSVGAVVRPELAPRIQENRQEALTGFIQECPTIRDYLAHAHRVTTGPYGQIRVRKDYSYWNTKFWRPGMVLIGDAACFVDPVLSSGVHLAGYSGLLAARSVNSVLENSVTEEEAFTEFEQRYRHEYGIFYEFLSVFYNSHAERDSYYWSAKQITNSASGEFEAFINLAAGMGSPQTAETVTDRLRHHSSEVVEALARLEPDSPRNAALLGRTTVASRTAPVEEELLHGTERTDFAGTLRASPDGLSWIRQD
ncbi:MULTISPECIES: tryptophan 7-halogenase [unclassified Streptomyces]|uniref:tryptophan 7-halogenase n=1 Tax=unclassified Streptomyces TaxID=2593676 RepID=UPI000DDACF76|nr:MULTISPECIES: tryptophan 7-halogenase [unclassified Streptomyces]QZZ25183.1 tryptophan 7-halogenase [Streptomyces sp. ST1015]